MFCREKLYTVNAIPSIKKVKAWDGKDAVIETNEVPLDELFKDE